MATKKLPKPAWYKNTYFWLATILFLLGVVGMISGNAIIRDPGQKHENGLAWLYFAAAAIMLVNGYMSHRQTVQHYNEVEGIEANG